MEMEITPDRKEEKITKRKKTVSGLLEKLRPDLLEQIEQERMGTCKPQVESLAKNLKIEPEEIVSIDVADFAVERRAALQRAVVKELWQALLALVHQINLKICSKEVQKEDIKDLTAALKDLSHVLKEQKLPGDAADAALANLSDKELEAKITELKAKDAVVYVPEKPAEKEKVPEEPLDTETPKDE